MKETIILFSDDSKHLSAALGNKDKLIKLGDFCLQKGLHHLAAKTYNLAKDTSKLNMIGDEFMKMGILGAALKCFESSENKMMVSFIRSNFSDKDLDTKIFI